MIPINESNLNLVISFDQYKLFMMQYHVNSIFFSMNKKVIQGNSQVQTTATHIELAI